MVNTNLIPLGRPCLYAFVKAEPNFQLNSTLMETYKVAAICNLK